MNYPSFVLKQCVNSFQSDKVNVVHSVFAAETFADFGISQKLLRALTGNDSKRLSFIRISDANPIREIELRQTNKDSTKGHSNTH